MTMLGTNQSAMAAKLLGMVEIIKKNPSLAKAIFKAQTQLDGGTQCSATVRKLPALIIDEPPEFGGNDKGPNPVELLLVSLGACQEIVYSLYAAVMGIQLESVTVALKGHLDTRGFLGIDESVPPGYQKISFETRIVSNAPTDSIEKLVQLVESRCPTLDTLRRPIVVTGDVYLNDARVRIEV